MALRLIEIIVQKKDAKSIHALLDDTPVHEFQELQLLDNNVLVRVLLDAEQSEPLLDILEKQHSKFKEARVVILSVEGTLPRIKDISETNVEQKPKNRIAREELYEDIKDFAHCSWVYLAMIALSTIVASVGLCNNSVAIIIGAMVIAPMLGPSIAMALGATLGDVTLLWEAMLTGLAGIALALVFSAIIGILVHIDPAIPEIASRTQVSWGEIAVALASGCAGALAFTTGVSQILIGVMVAVALLPPLVASGLLLGAGFTWLSMNALSLFAINLICINLAGVAMFLVQGIHPQGWRDKKRATKATYISLMLLLLILIILIALVSISK